MMDKDFPTILQWIETENLITAQEESWKRIDQQQDQQQGPPVTVPGGLTQAHLAPIAARLWKSVLSWIAFHPDEVSSLVDTNGQTALHHACLFKAPAYIVQNLLYAAPEAAAVANHDGELPIHWAIRVSAPNEIILLLLEAYPPSGIIADHSGLSPLDLVWDRNFEQLEKITSNHQLEQNRAWQRLMTFLQFNQYSGGITTTTTTTHQQQHQQQHTKFRTLHATMYAVASSQGTCPAFISFVRFVMRRYSEQALQRDEHGDTPLLVALSKKPHRSNHAYFTIMIQELLTMCPRLIRLQNRRGRCPLVVALANGHSWEHGVRALFQAEPRSIHEVDPVTRFYPSVLAATVQRDDDDDEIMRQHQLDTMYHLFRLDPSALLVVNG
eukprot:CAMPEP_0118683204 /NCGR_PEP_ID=MMETSP0800-20121206/5909_1 /TAXON_ID=210618 ORGANISM="Striatella unipunctata, Strain CCMP2910" /NCGR_SAMPLE_ID=MMETSP0800 /ASSEMBLY_ACC=CAM_ASM_000638 /LENGTH=382 /DNA_ID=CAMNT_0006579675 /DNA_START=70 /DNA_END=1218 /DNA_ORIENTATION=-